MAMINTLQLAARKNLIEMSLLINGNCKIKISTFSKSLT
jgi:hypothetical protein